MKRIVVGWLVFAAVLGVIAPSIAYAQASITGVVKDTSGAVVPGVTVEASSPALIEKVRSVISDGAGQYRIVDLRPGTYAVTFSLTGFTSVKRDAIELSGSFTAVVNAELKVGAVDETLTVNAESPLVDLQGAKKETVLTKDVVDSIPSGRTAATLGVLIPGVTVAVASFFVPGNQDVGGSRGADWTQLGIHGGRGDDMTTMINGVATNDIVSREANVNLLAFQEVALETSALSAEEATGGIRMNLVPREGGNAFSGSLFTTYGNDSLQAGNLSDDLKSRGLLATTGQKKGFDFNPGFGGPIKRDKLWFFMSGRVLQLDNFAGGAVFNRNAGSTVTFPKSIIYAPDVSLGRAVATNEWTDVTAQLTWQATAKNKFSFGIHRRTAENVHSFVGSVVGGTLVSPEAGLSQSRPGLWTWTADWTSPISSRILVEAHYYDEEFPRGGYAFASDVSSQMPSVVDSGLGVRYGAFGPSSLAWEMREIRYRGSVSYVTGTHTLKIGAQNASGHSNTDTFERNPLTYFLASGRPTAVQLDAGPVSNYIDRDAQVGLFAQDKWTLNSWLTLTGALRYDYFKTSFPATPLGPGPLFPTRNLTLPAGPNVDWKDVTYRSAAVFDPFRKGKTAVRVSLNKYVLNPKSDVTGSYGLSNNFAIVQAATRSWNDTNGNLFADCDMTNFAANGECGPITDQNFGKVVPGGNVDPAVREGYGVRPYNWELSAGVQHQIARRVSVDVAYYRRWFGNFTVADDRSVSASDFDTFSIPVPTDARLPNSGGTVIGLVNLKPSSFGRPSQGVTTFTDSIGADQIEHWNGVDINLTTRLAGLTLAGGTSTGRTSTDRCEVNAIAPESMFATFGSGGGVTGLMTPNGFCHVDSKFLTQVKGFASFTIPRVDVQIAASVQSLAGPQIVANYVATNAVVAPSLGRSLAGGASSLSVQIVPPGQSYGDRLNQLDLRLAKIIKYRKLRMTPSLDLFNVTNGNAVITENASYGAFRAPTAITQGRLVKFTLNVTF